MDSKRNTENTSKKPRIVEIVGLAGVGKTTLCNELGRYHEHICLSNFPAVRKISAAPFFIWNGLQIVPAILNLSGHDSRNLTRREFAWLSILKGWPVVLQGQLKNNKPIILEQGPVYLLAEINEFGPAYLREQKARFFWQGLYSRWANMLDVIVWLDAADPDLIRRIRGRDKAHVMKDESIETILEFLARYRNAYKQTISDLSVNHPGLRILRFDTTCQTPRVIANQLLAEFGLNVVSS
ncbi:MAG: hypothetical protein WCC12_08165 [Anaerolineales bacterium]